MLNEEHKFNEERFFKNNPTLLSKIRRLAFPTTWDEFTNSPVISMLQFGLTAMILVFFVAILFNNNSKKKESTLIKECENSIKNYNQRLKITEMKFNVLNSRSQKKQLTDKYKNEISSLRESLVNYKYQDPKENQTKDYCVELYDRKTKDLFVLGDEAISLTKKIKKL